MAESHDEPNGSTVVELNGDDFSKPGLAVAAETSAPTQQRTVTKARKRTKTGCLSKALIIP